jgi:hypothetical protein
MDATSKLGPVAGAWPNRQAIRNIGANIFLDLINYPFNYFSPPAYAITELKTTDPRCWPARSTPLTAG